MAIFETKTSQNGRYIVSRIVVEQQEILLVNIYAPNEDTPEFFHGIFAHVTDSRCQDVLMAGDFNFVLDKNLDQVNRKNNNDKARNTVTAFLEEIMLIDVWRRQNPERFRFTHFKKNSKTYARLDYIFVTYTLLPAVEEAQIHPSYKSDHCPVSVGIKPMQKPKRGPGLWKLNTQILTNIDYVNEINQEIETEINKTEQCEPCA